MQLSSSNNIVLSNDYEYLKIYNSLLQSSTAAEVPQIVPSSSSDEELNISINTDDEEETEEQIIERRRQQREQLMKVLLP